jgi:hypothetical protein
METNTDADVVAALGVGTVEDEDDQATPEVEVAPDDEGQEPESVTPSNIEELPDWAQSEIRKARREAAEARIKARDALPDAERMRAEIRDEVQREYASKLAAAAIRTALSEIKPEYVEDIIDDLNLDRFVLDGDVDKAAVKSFSARVLGVRRSRAEVGTGAGQNGTPRKRTTADQFADTISGMFS